jgi:uncharacterized protein (TIGR03435 family)
MGELSVMAKATIILGAALVGAWLARGSAAAVRALILASAFAVLLAMPLTELLLPLRSVEIPLPAIASEASFPPATARRGEAPAAVGRSLVPASSRPVLGRGGIIMLLRGIWLGGVLVVGIRLAIALRRLTRLRRSGEPWRDPEAQTILRQATSRRVRLFVHRDLAAPMTCGILRPIIGLPLDARTWSRADLRQALIHEVEHISRGDWLVQLLARVACGLYWFHPLAWLAARRLQLECEHACDDAVVRAGDRTSYAQQLVSMARRLSDRPSASALSMADRHHLAKRVDAVLNPARPHGAVRARTVAMTAAAAAVVAIGIAPWRAVAAQSSSRTEDVLPIPTALTGQAFEHVSIRSGDRQGPEGSSFDPATGRFVARNKTLQWLISRAYAPVASLEPMPDVPYELHDSRIVGGPDWIDADRFVVEATAGTWNTAEDLQVMLRQLLHDSFDLFVRVERQETAVYRLVRARADGGVGPGLQPGQQGCADRLNMEGGGPGEIVRRCTTLAALAADFSLAEVLGRPVVDRTALAGVFDVSLSYAPTRGELSTIYELSPSEVPRELLARPSIFAAFERQLGLRLESTRGVTYTLAVDYAARPAQAR